jgi:hypothetical protein
VGGACSTHENINDDWVLVGKPEAKRPLIKPRRRREDDIKMDPREIGLDVMVWINLVQDRDQWRAVIKPRVP